jgi:hypothetical protein
VSPDQPQQPSAPLWTLTTEALFQRACAGEQANADLQSQLDTLKAAFARQEQELATLRGHVCAALPMPERHRCPESDGSERLRRLAEVREVPLATEAGA